MSGAGNTSESLLIELSWPASALSPNNSTHHMVRHRYAKAAKNEAGWATKIAMPFDWAPAGETVAVKVRAYPPKNWSTGDKDNFSARLKHHFDGIAAILGINDRQFDSPIVEWADKTEKGKVVVVLS